MSSSRSILVVGGGLAGSWLAYTLYKLGHQVTLVDQPLVGASSVVAAGLFHPAPGLRCNLREGFAQEYPFAKAAYQALEQTANTSLWNEINLERTWSAAQKSAILAKKSNFKNLLPWVVEQTEKRIVFHSSGWVDVPRAIALLQAPLCATGNVRRTVFEDAELTINTSKEVCWRGENYAAVVLCRGWREAQSKWTKQLQLPWRNAAGELLECQLFQASSKCIEADSIWKIPLGKGIWRCGATHRWHELSSGPSRAAVQQLLGKLAKNKPQIQQVRYGVRPVQQAKHVLAQPVDKHGKIWLFNSLGSHGAIRAPLYAHKLAQRLCV